MSILGTSLARTGALLLLAVVLPLPAGGETIRVPADLPLQAAIDAAAPGDTVLVAPGDYARPATVEAAILIAGEGSGVRLGGLTGGGARLENLVFVGNLTQGRNRLVEVTSSLTLENCRFEGAVQGIDLREGALELDLRSCRFVGQVQAVTLSVTATAVTIDDTVFENCLLAVTTPSAFECEGGDRRPAGRCAVACGTLTISRSEFTGGDVQVTVGPGFALTLSDCVLSGARLGVEARGSRVDLRDSDFSGTLVQDTALELTSGTGTMTGCTLVGFSTAVRVGDGGDGCAAWSDFTIGGSIESANIFQSNPVNLSVEQPERVPAEFNHWGSLDCASVQESILGQGVGTILDASLSLVVPCSVPVAPRSWGGLKREAGTSRGEPR